MSSRPFNAAALLAGLAIVLVTFAAYVAGYFWLGKLSNANQGISVVNGVHYRAPRRWCRNFNTSWQAALYEPGGQLESWLRGVDIEVTSADD